MCRTLELLAETKGSFVSAVKNIFNTKTMATLKISDLSVGDWVGFEMANLSIEGDDIATAFVEKINKPARIKSILGDQDLILAEVDNVDNFGTIYLKLENISPVPITAEILEKNGFKRHPKYGRFYCSESQLEVAFENGEWIHIISSFEYPIHTISGVHHIQHLLRLYGCEKEINL